jgi:hypothetical protein
MNGDEIGYPSVPFDIRDDLPSAHRRSWQRLARPGTWWSGAERVAIAAEVRNAADCGLCVARAAALSRSSVRGEHDVLGSLPAAAVEVTHTLARGARRVSRSWFDEICAAGLADTEYVEIIGLVVTVVSIDSFCRGVGAPLHALPTPQPGEPTRQRPASAKLDVGWVPTIAAGDAVGAEANLYGGATNVPNVLRALSLVPEEVRGWMDLSEAHYFGQKGLMDMTARRSLDRMQIELLAGRVSALNECFY